MISEFDKYYMLMAVAVRNRANCTGRKVGAIIVKHNRVISTGYNGTPEGMQNCREMGCIRCKDYALSGEYYDKCICVHAEQNAITTAARLGHSIEHSIAYSTLQPCFTCLKIMLQAKVKTIIYIEELVLKPDPNDKKYYKYEKTPKKKAKQIKQDQDFYEQYKILENRFEKFPFQMNRENLIEHFSKMKEYLNVS